MAIVTEEQLYGKRRDYQVVHLHFADIEMIAQKTAEALRKVEDRVLNVEEAAELLRRSVGSVRQLVQRGKIPCHKVGGRIYFSESELKQLLLSPRTVRKRKRKKKSEQSDSSGPEKENKS